MIPNLKAVLFDFDGLLFDSEPYWDKAYYKFLEIKNLKDELEDEEMGMGLREFIDVWKKHGLKGGTERLMDEFRSVFYEFFLSQENLLMSGSIEILNNVASKGLTLGVTTGGHSEKMVKEILKRVGILRYFGLITSSDDIEKGKPAPDIYLHSLEKLGLKATEVLALEDSANGVKAAVAAKVNVYGVNREPTIRKKLEDAGANKVFSSLNEVSI